MNLPADPVSGADQKWRIVWDSALDRREVGEAIASRFDGAVTYSDRKGQEKGKRARRRFRSTAVLDWSTLHPVERLELLTTHDLARQEKQKLALLRHLLTYYHYAAAENREDVLRTEINRVRDAANELRDRYRAEGGVLRANACNDALQAAVSGQQNDADTDFDDAHTQVLSSRPARHLIA